MGCAGRSQPLPDNRPFTAGHMGNCTPPTAAATFLGLGSSWSFLRHQSSTKGTCLPGSKLTKNVIWQLGMSIQKYLPTETLQKVVRRHSAQGDPPKLLDTARNPKAPPGRPVLSTRSLRSTYSEQFAQASHIHWDSCWQWTRCIWFSLLRGVADLQRRSITW